MVVGMICAVVTAVVGNFLVAARQSVISDMLAHTSLAGVGLGVLFHVSPLFMAIAVSMLASMMLVFLGNQKKLPKEAISVLLLSGGIAIALLCVHVSRDNTISLDSFLFGSLLTITPNEMIWFIALSLSILSIIALMYNRFIALVFDTEFFQSRVAHARWIEIGFMLMSAVLIASSLKIIGGLLITSLLVIPALASQYIATSFRASLFWSISINLISVVVGIIWSFYADVPTSSAIVITLMLVFVSVAFIKK